MQGATPPMQMRGPRAWSGRTLPRLPPTRQPGDLLGAHFLGRKVNWHGMGQRSQRRVSQVTNVFSYEAHYFRRFKDETLKCPHKEGKKIKLNFMQREKFVDQITTNATWRSLHERLSDLPRQWRPRSPSALVGMPPDGDSSALLEVRVWKEGISYTSCNNG